MVQENFINDFEIFLSLHKHVKKSFKIKILAQKSLHKFSNKTFSNKTIGNTQKIIIKQI
jgi:hypothetical protein